MNTGWDDLDTKGRADAIRPLAEDRGMSSGQIARYFHVTRNVIIGYMARNKIRPARRALTNTTVAAIDRRQHLAKNRFEKFSGPQFSAKVAPVVLSKPEAWKPLDGSTPKPVEHHLAGAECRWPVYDGNEPKRFCCLPVAGNPHYCAAHAAMAFRKVG